MLKGASYVRVQGLSEERYGWNAVDSTTNDDGKLQAFRDDSLS